MSDWFGALPWYERVFVGALLTGLAVSPFMIMWQLDRVIALLQEIRNHNRN